MTDSKDKAAEGALEELRRLLRGLLGTDIDDVLVLGVRYEDFDLDRPVLSVGISPDLPRGRYAKIPSQVDGFPVQKYRTHAPRLGG
jgi:hypothetical protein